MAAVCRSTPVSMRLILVLTAQSCPPMQLALPGPVTTVVTPAARASAKQRSRWLTASMARSWGAVSYTHLNKPAGAEDFKNHKFFLLGHK